MRRCLPPLLAALLLLAGCSAMLERSYVTEQPHTEQSAADADVLRAEDYESLVLALGTLVEDGAERGVIRLYGYAGDVAEDVPDACLAATNDDPLGAYSVSYISHEWTRIVSYYEVTVRISYRRTVAQVARIVSITGMDGLREELTEALSHGDAECVLRVGRFAGTREDAELLAAEVLAALYPPAADGTPDPAAPGVAASLYPAEGEGETRIVEFLVTWPAPPTESGAA